MTSHDEPTTLATPPHDAQAERAVLGGMLMSAHVVAEVLPLLSAADFYVPKHGMVFDAITAMFAAGKPVDAITLVEELSARGELKRVGGASFVHDLVSSVPVAANAIYYAANIVAPLSARRRLAEVGLRIAQLAHSEHDDPAGAAQQLLLDATDTGRDNDVQSLSELLNDSMDWLEHLGEANTALSTGLIDVDKVLGGGLKPGQLIVVAGRPSMGKSALGLDMIRHAAIHQNRPTLMSSLEMSKNEVLQRILAAETGLDLKVFNGEEPLSDEHWSTVSQTMGRIADAPLHIDDSPHATIVDIRAKAQRRAARNGGLDLIVVDYLQLMPSPRRADTREREVAEISRGLKLLAKDLECPLIAVAQLNRGPETRTDKRPMMSDLRESGALEADADVVVLLYRDEYYDPESPRSGEIDIHIAKNRGGRTDTVTAAAQLHKARIVSIA